MENCIGLLSMLIILTLADAEDPTVHTSLGSIEGHWQVSRSGKRFQAYEGIPYALPPIGALRFEPPQPVTPWEGVLPAKFHPPACLQYEQNPAITRSMMDGSEDCLYLQVYTPLEKLNLLNDTELLPVIILIYGSVFNIESSSKWKPNNFMDKNVVLVSMNYRVGPLGFLSTENEVVTGNMGLKDQALAMKWVSGNIASFGGDPNRVTLAGLSSGGSSVHLHYLSPMSRGLFHRGISGSGTALNPWSQTRASLVKAKKISSSMGCPTISIEDMISCLKTRPARAILAYTRNVMGYLCNPFVPFGPVVENGSTDPFLDKSPIEIITSGKSADLPWIVSSDTEEGIYPVAEFIDNDNQTEYINENWESIAPSYLNYNYTIPASEHTRVAKYIRNIYMGDKRIERNNANDVIRMVGDRLFTKDTGEAAMKQARLYDSPVWFFVFGYRGEYSLGNFFTTSHPNLGVAHSDESYYLFAMNNKPLHTEKDVLMSRILVNMWYSFAATGVPDIGFDWTPVNRSSDGLNYLLISSPANYSMQFNENYGEKNFWNTIDFDENKLRPKNAAVTQTQAYTFFPMVCLLVSMLYCQT